jgi:pseudoazurin
MFKSFATALALGTLVTGAAFAENHDVQMLNRGDAGAMVYEPAFLQIAPGDTVTFIPTDRGHNAESIDGMIPEGAEPFSGRINEEITVTFDVEGLYGIRCTPHYAMGMVMTIAVGEEVAVPEDFLEGRIPRTALQRFEEQLSNL